uniref:AVL9 homolog (S. cerevisiase) n=1 Tax=Cyprinus carpio TaxID=7962 RepID=A0A8C1ZCT9_CYPCA
MFVRARRRKGPVLHIVVVGFHHKKGCQVEFSYPPIIPGAGHDSNTLPEEWKYLPFLALPDGAHNHQEGKVSIYTTLHKKMKKYRRLSVLDRTVNNDSKQEGECELCVQVLCSQCRQNKSPATNASGYLCMPYMALQQHHLLSDISVRGFVAGATNILFRQQRHLSDAIVDVDEARIQIHDPELRKMLYLSTADLRFADYLVKHVTENKEDVFLDGTGWEGGDEWIRAQFGLYIHSLLSSALQQDHERLLADYGTAFTSAWKITHNYRVWISNKHPAMANITPGHPFQGQYSVADVKIRLSHSMQNSERGKKFGNAVMSTSRSVVQTGKAVGKMDNRLNCSLVNSFLFNIKLISHTICSSSTNQPYPDSAMLCESIPNLHFLSYFAMLLQSYQNDLNYFFHVRECSTAHNGKSKKLK